MGKFIKEKYKYIDEQIPILINEKKTIREICSFLKVSRSTINRRLKKYNLNVPNYHNSLKFDNTVFDSIDTEEKAYWLGFLYADGNIHSTKNIVSLNLKGSDYKHIEKFRNFLKASKNIRNTYIKVNNKKYSVCNFSICDKHLKNTLISLGCFPKKSLLLKFPPLSIFKEYNLVYHFIRGYVDGDGCLTFSKNGRLNLSILGTKEFLEGICNIFPNMFASINKVKRLQTNVYTISNCGEKADEVTYKLYHNSTIYLDRKYDRFAVLNRKV